MGVGGGGDNSDGGEEQLVSSKRARQMLAKRGRLCRCDVRKKNRRGLGGDFLIALVVFTHLFGQIPGFGTSNILKDSTVSNTISDVKRWFHACYKRAVVQTLNRSFVVLSPGQRAGLLITVTVNISGAGKQNLQRLAESLVGFPPAYLDPPSSIMHDFRSCFLNFNPTKEAFHIRSVH